MVYTVKSGDDGLRALEREARESRDEGAWAHYLANCERKDAQNVLNTSAALLQTNEPCSRKPALETLVRNGGVWIERDDAKSIVHVHGVMLSSKHNQPEEAYTLSWAQDRLQHAERDYHAGDNHYFTQATASRLLPAVNHPSGLKLVVPIAPERDSTLRALVRAREFGRQPELVDYVQQLMRSDYNDWCLTSDRITYGKKGKLIRAFGREDREEIPVDLRGNSTYVRDLQDPQAMLKLFLGTDEPIAQVDERYNRFLDVPNGTFLWRITGTGERALVLGRGDVRFYIDANGYFGDYGPLRGCRRAKFFP